MARTIPDSEAWPYDNSKQRYPWDEWLDGRTWLLFHGEDFTVSAASMSAMARTSGNVRGVRVRTKKVGPDLQIQAII